MHRWEEILKTYELADAEQRLQLFMAHRELRDEFQEIDQRQPELFDDELCLQNQRSIIGGVRELNRRLLLCWGVLRGRHL